MREAHPQRIDHDVSYEVHTLHADALATEVVGGGTFGRVEHVADLVGEQAIDLLGHRPIEAPQARLDMYYRDALLDGHQAARQRGIDVSDHDYATRRRDVDHGLEAAHDLRGLLRVGAGADVEHDVRCAQLEVGKQQILHFRVVMLPGMH